MASITNYTTLVEAIISVTEDDGVEFAEYIPTAIDLAEERLFRELDLPEIETKQTGNTIPNMRRVQKPANYEFSSQFIVNGNILKKKTESFIRDYWPVETNVGIPKYYTDEDEENFIIAPTPATNLPYELKYTAKPNKLSSTNQTNFYVENCNDVLYAAALLEVAIFMKAWSQVQLWEGKYTQHRDTWNLQQARYRRDEGIMPNSPDTGPNSLKHTINSNA